MVGKQSNFRGRNGGGRTGKRRNEELPARTAKKKRSPSGLHDNEIPLRNQKQQKLSQMTEKSNVKGSANVEDNNPFFQNDTNAYNDLLFSLQGKGGIFANAYAQRQREEEGASSSEEEDEKAEEFEDSRGIAEVEESDRIDENDAIMKAKDEVDQVDHGENNSEEDEEDDEEDEGGEGDKEGEDEDDEGQDFQVLSKRAGGGDAKSKRIASNGQAGICLDPFRCHLEHQFTAIEEETLLQSLEKSSEKKLEGGTPGMSWVFRASSTIPKVENSLAAHAVKKRLQDSWFKAFGVCSHGVFKSELQRQFFALCSNYKDILYTNRSVDTGRSQSGEDFTIIDAYVMHILNHVMKTRDLLTKDNDKVRQPNAEHSDPPRDQGYTRPKVLVLLPFRSSAVKFVTSLLKLMPHPQETNVENKRRFFDDFGAAEDNAEEDNDLQSTKGKKSTKPADFVALFSGNNDDHFRIGIKFTRKSVKLYTDFYSSDIIVASPLGLITKIGEADTKKDKDVDFLSSIEIAVVDYTEVILMQNWLHVVSVFDYLNQLPARQHGTDFMRIREWYLNGHARHYRQTIIVSSFPDAGVNALFRRSCLNHAGKVKSQCDYEGALSKIVLQVRQVFEKIECASITEVDDARFEFFVKKVFPQIKNSIQGGTMIFIRSYFDYVRLRNFLKSESASFCLLGEYASTNSISRARFRFFHGERKVLLYTQRAHFFHRYKIRGIKDLIFYSLPDYAHFYMELLNLLEGKDNPSCTVLFSRFDSLQLERVVGSVRSRRMLSSPKKLFMFC